MASSPSTGGNKGFIFLFLFLAVSGLLVFLAFLPSNTEKLKTAKQSVTDMMREAKARTLPHTAFDKVLTPGNAWEEYNIALSDTATWKEGDPNELFLRSLDEEDVARAEVEQFLAQHASAVEHLQLGAHRSDGQYPYQWDKGSQMPRPSRDGSMRLARVAAVQAQRLREKGKTQESIDLLVDTTVFGRDLATNSPSYANLPGLYVYAIAFTEMRQWIASGKRTRAQLVDLDRKLEIIERDFPTVGMGAASLLLTLGIQQKEMAEGGAATGDWWRLVKHGHVRLLVSPQNTIAEALEERNSFLRRIEKLDQMDFAASKKEADAIVDEMGRSPNPLISEATPGMKAVVVDQRDVLARLRLLRAATGLLLTGKMPVLGDPFGDKLHSKQENEKTKIWSFGRDGKNQDGRGDWNTGKRDMVLEIPSPK